MHDTLTTSPAPATQADKRFPVYLDFQVAGARCAGCVQKIESRIEGMKGVVSARLNLSLGRLKVVVMDGPVPADIMAAVKGLGYDATDFGTHDDTAPERDEDKRLLKALAVAGVGAGNVMLLSFAVWMGREGSMGPATVGMFNWLSALVALPVVFYAGAPLYGSAFRSLRAGQVNMDVPISVGIFLTMLISLYQMTVPGGETYFEAATSLLFFLLIGRYLDKAARSRARAAIEGLLTFQQMKARVLLQDGTVQLIKAATLTAGTRVFVPAGEHVPSDGMVESGETELDTAAVTGEIVPRPARPGDRVFGGTVNLAAPITVLIDTAPESSLAAQTLHLMDTAAQKRTRYVQLANRAAAIYAPVVHAVAALTFLGWWLVGGLPWTEAMLVAISVLIITCPCALGLAIPAVQIVANGKLFQNGILQKSGDGLERLCDISDVVFDKTGTLTMGTFKLLNAGDVPPCLAPLIGALAAASSHPLCRAIADAIPTGTQALQSVREIPGKGIEGRVGGLQVRLGNRAFCDAEGDASDDHSEVFIRISGHPAIRLIFEETLRPHAAATVAALRNMGLGLAIASGDRAAAVARVAAVVGIPDWRAAQLPTDKAALIETGIQAGRNILMVGDGLNDGPALALAHVSMAPASGLDISTARADLVFRTLSLHAVAYALKVARTARTLMRQNLAFAIAYNLVAIPVAIAGHASPPLAAVAMSFSSLIVIGNALRLHPLLGR